MKRRIGAGDASSRTRLFLVPAYEILPSPAEVLQLYQIYMLEQEYVLYITDPTEAFIHLTYYCVNVYKIIDRFKSTSQHRNF